MALHAGKHSGLDQTGHAGIEGKIFGPASALIPPATVKVTNGLIGAGFQAQAYPIGFVPGGKRPETVLLEQAADERAADLADG
jgi:hypothetical protein